MIRMRLSFEAMSTTTPQQPTTPPQCTVTDAYGYVWTCKQWNKMIEPCTADGSTLYYIAECGPHNPTMAQWCKAVPTHPVCVNVGLPKTGPTSVGPVAGGGMLALVAGLVLLVAARRKPARP